MAIGASCWRPTLKQGSPNQTEHSSRWPEGADVLIHDAQYLPDEIETYKGWGHSTWEQAAHIAEDAGVERLVIISHDPERTDEGVDAAPGRRPPTLSRTPMLPTPACS